MSELGTLPELLVWISFSLFPSHVKNAVSQRAKGVHGATRDVLIDQNVHSLESTGSIGVTCSSAREAA